MAHWDEERDKRWVAMMRECKVPNSEEIIRKYEETGNDSHWYEFIEFMRADELRKQQLRAKGLSST
jgi:hypothetical protein